MFFNVLLAYAVFPLAPVVAWLSVKGKANAENHAKAATMFAVLGLIFGLALQGEVALRTTFPAYGLPTYPETLFGFLFGTWLEPMYFLAAMVSTLGLYLVGAGVAAAYYALASAMR